MLPWRLLLLIPGLMAPHFDGQVDDLILSSTADGVRCLALWESVGHADLRVALWPLLSPPVEHVVALILELLGDLFQVAAGFDEFWVSLVL